MGSISSNYQNTGANWRRRFILLFLLGAALWCFYTLLEPYWLENKFYTISSKEIPQAFDRTRIVLVSDIHHGPYFSKKRIGKLVQRVNRLRPDLVVLGGDYIQQKREYVRPCFDALKYLRAPLGVYGVMGNHDHREGADLIRQNMKENQFKLLDNRALWVSRGGARIKIGGVGDYLKDSQDVKPTIRDVAVRDFVILVSHNPDYIEELRTNKIDLMLCGHTHGGQVTVFGLYAPRIPSRYGQKFRTGRIIRNHMTLLVANGVGTEGLPIRFFARPQIVTVILRKGEKK